MLKKEFGNDKNLRVIAEPGRFICQEAMSVVMKIILAKQCQDGSIHYFVNSGIYQSLGC